MSLSVRTQWTPHCSKPNRYKGPHPNDHWYERPLHFMLMIVLRLDICIFITGKTKIKEKRKGRHYVWMDFKSKSIYGWVAFQEGCILNLRPSVLHNAYTQISHLPSPLCLNKLKAAWLMSIMSLKLKVSDRKSMTFEAKLMSLYYTEMT